MILILCEPSLWPTTILRLLLYRYLRNDKQNLSKKKSRWHVDLKKGTVWFKSTSLFVAPQICVSFFFFPVRHGLAVGCHEEIPQINICKIGKCAFQNIQNHNCSILMAFVWIFPEGFAPKPPILARTSFKKRLSERQYITCLFLLQYPFPKNQRKKKIRKRKHFRVASPTRPFVQNFLKISIVIFV